MHFKELQLFGFKSFAEKTKIKFEPGITAIVGPNGVGKSNITDSIRWVLGEQSAKELRGSKMEDIIFNGTDSKEPLGFAEVSLTLSNPSKFLPIEYDEVTISRRLFRSGESEYLINKTPVRLKDINDLLAGSGLGVEAYSIIEQGKIGMILSSNTEERRYIFEEASGIIKYKTKKKEALRRLESTENNLIRVNDIIIEVKRQIASIERQARKAQRYKEYLDKLKELDCRHARYQYNQLKENELNYQNNHRNLQEKKKLLNSKIAEVTDMAEELKSKLAYQDSKILASQSKSMDIDFSVKSNQDMTRLDKERVQELQELQSDLRDEIKMLEERIDRLSAKQEKLNSQFSAISNDKTQKDTLLRQNEEKLGDLQRKINENQSNIKTNKTKTVNILADQSKTKNEITKTTSEIQNNQARLRRLRVENQKVTTELGGIEKNLEEAKSLVEEVNSKLEKLNEEKEKLSHILEKDRALFSQLDSKIRDYQNEFHSLQSKLKLLEDLVKRHEGFTGGTKALLEKIADGKPDLEGLEKPIAELMEVKKGYEIPVEAVMGADLEAIVVNDWKAALSAIKYLKEKKLGRASFVNKFVERKDSSDISISTYPSVLGKLVDFVKVSAEYEPIIQNLLRNSILVKDIDSALEIFKDKQMPQDLRLVTLKGQIVKNGLIVGGSVNEDSSTSLIGRQARIDQTKLDIEKLLAESVILKKQQNEKRESIIQIEEKFSKITEALRREEIDLAEKNSKKFDLEKEFKKISDELSLIGLEIEETSQNINRISVKESSLKERLKEIEENYTTVQNVITNSQAFINEGSKKREELLVDIAQLKTELVSLAKEEENLKDGIESQRTYLEEQNHLLETKNTNLSSAADKEKELIKKIEGLEQDSKKLITERYSIEKSFKVLKEAREDLFNLIQKSEGEIKSHQSELSTVKDHIHNLQMDGTQISFKMENLKNRIKDDYKIDMDSVSIDNEDQVNWDWVAREITGYKEKMERLGPVSLVALQEHEELKERFSFLMRQQEDLLNAKESLLKAIKKVNQTTRQLFMDTFNKIQVEFRNFFRYLFGGGKADILLVDPRDVLESDIEIIVRPPGKKLQSISLLSGGEKALAAISLMFAIFKVKPSPFYLLDEVDAPLDDSNIGRFSKLLEDFAKQTQFIIITHNKKTISLADVMYGITIDRAGISRIVSVKFAKGKKEAVFV